MEVPEALVALRGWKKAKEAASQAKKERGLPDVVQKVDLKAVAARTRCGTVRSWVTSRGTARTLGGIVLRRGR